MTLSKDMHEKNHKKRKKLGTKGRHCKKNLGFGRKIKFAVKTIFYQFSENGFAGANDHYRRCCRFIVYLENAHNIHDLNHVTYEYFLLYAEYISLKVEVSQLSVSYAHNLISSVNRLFYIAKKNNEFFIAPSSFLPRRSHIRIQAPNMSIEDIENACEELEKNGLKPAAIQLKFARFLGLRRREALMLDCKNALIEYNEFKKINITAGTKGGRGKNIERWVPVCNRGLQALIAGAELQADNTSFIELGLNQIQSYRKYEREIRTVIKKYHLNKMHDLRAAYVCARHEELTKYKAAVLGGNPVFDEAYKEKLHQISLEIGHNREYVIYSYSGKT